MPGSMLLKGTTWLYLVLQLQMIMMKFHNIRLEDILVPMKLFGERHPVVVHLALHLENGQRVYFTAENAVQIAERPPPTTLILQNICTRFIYKTLLHSKMIKYFTWNASNKKLQRRRQGEPVPGYVDLYSTEKLGSIYKVHPNNDECFYLRLLLVNVRRPTSFSCLRCQC